MRTVFIVAGPLPDPAPDFDTLPEDPDSPGLRLVPVNGRVSIRGEEWHFRSIWSFALHDAGYPWPVKFSGPDPTITMPGKCEKVDITISVGPKSVLGEAEDPPFVIDRGGYIPKWGQA